MPNQLPTDRRGADRWRSRSPIPASGRGGSSSELARPKWGGIVVSPNGVWKVLCRHGLNTRAKRSRARRRLRRLPTSRLAIPRPERHIDVERPGELVGIDCFYVGRLRGTEGAIWQLTAIDICLLLRLGRAGGLPSGNPTAKQTSKLAQRVAARPQGSRLAPGARALRQRQRVQGRLPHDDRASEGTPHPHPRRPPADQRPRRGAAQDDPRRVLATSLRPLPLPPLHRPQARARRATSRYYNLDRVHHGRLTRGASPPTSSTVPARWRRDEPHLSAHLGGCPSKSCRRAECGARARSRSAATACAA